jgi:eukaryotic-like serine/threonine-protein kinase
VKIGPYEVLLELGRGGMGTVYLARLSGAGGFERLVAIKRAHATALAHKDMSERFLREARLAASVHHANVVGIHQVGEDQAGQYLVSDYVEGEALDRLIEGSGDPVPVPTAIALRIVLDALAGLHAAHETVDNEGRPLGILHRDVSIENLLVGRDGVTRLTDFGIAKTSHGPGLTEAGTIHGKLMYLTPEYLQGAESERGDDTYAMGVTLWIALAGAFPYRARDNAALTHEVLARPIPALGTVGVAVGPLLDACLTRALSRDPHARFQTARAMLDALDEVSQRETPAARHHDVADFVERVAGDRLAQRRAKIQAQRVARDDPSRGEASRPPDAAVFESSQSITISQVRPRSSRWLWLTLIAGASAFILWFVTRSPEPARTAGPATPASSAAPGAGVEPALRVPEASAPVRFELPRASEPVVEALPDAALPTTEPTASPRPRSARRAPARTQPAESPRPPALDISTDNPYRK